MSAIAIIVLEVVGSLAAFLIYSRIMLARCRRKAAADEAAGVNRERPFEPKPERIPGFLMDRFSVPERAYLRQQLTLGKAFYYLGAWVYTIMFTSGLLPGFVDRYGLEQPLAQRVWYSYLLHVSAAGVIFVIMMLMGASLTVSGITSGAPSIFNRTRPLTIRFLYWARILPAIATIFASLATGLALSFVALLIFYGPVWLHLLDTARRVHGSLVISGINGVQSRHLVQMIQTSPPRFVLSLLTTALLIFSVAVAIISQPFSFAKKGAAGFIVPVSIAMGIFGSETAESLSGPVFQRWSHALFLYPHPGPPPPYSDAFLPILIAVAVLFAAQWLIPKNEV